MLDYGLSQQQLAVICALSNGATVTAAAEQAGVHRNTIANWRRNYLPFQQALAGAQYDRALLFREKMEDLADLAAKTIRDILADPQAPASVRLKAALAVIQTASTPPLPKKQVELDLEKVVIARDPAIASPVAAAGHQPALVHNAAQSAPSPQKAPTAAQPSSTIPAAVAPMTNPAQIRRETPKIGRNEPCPCGSGQKYKRCCLNGPRAKAA